MIGGAIRTISLACACVAIHGLAAAQDTTANAPSTAPVTWLIFVDDLHLEFRHTGRIRDAVRLLTSELIRKGDRFAITSSGPSGLAVAMTTDRESLGSAIKSVIANGLRLDDVLGSPGGAAEARYRAHTALSSARSMLESVPRGNGGPKALLYISNGYSYELLPDSVPGARRMGRGFDFTRVDVHQQLTAVTSIAAGLGIPIYAIHPPVSFGEPTATPVDPDPGEADHRREMRRTLEAIAAASGGFAIDEGDFAAQLRRIGEAVRK